jgi:hypothetical protein
MFTELHFFLYFLTKQKKKERKQATENDKIGKV